MCVGLEILGTLLGTAGSLVTASEQQRNAERMAEARTNELKRHLVKNDALAQTTREEFARRNAEADQQGVQADQNRAQAERETALETAVQSSPAEDAAVVGVSTSGSAPQVVRAEMAKRMSDAIGETKQQAQRAAKLGSYGDAWMQQGFKDVEANRQISVDANFAAGNSALLPHQQDFAETRAYRPVSPIGGLLQGFGSMLGSAGGSFGAARPERRVDPWKGMR